MVNWKRLTDAQVDDLFLFQQEGEVILVDPEAHFASALFMMFEAEKVFSEKQINRYKKVTPTELEVVKDKLIQLGERLSWGDYGNDSK